MRELNFKSKKPLLYLLATPIGNLGDISNRFIEVMSEIDIVACEDTRVSGKLLNHLGVKKQLISLHEHNEVSSSEKIVKLILSGKKVAYMSDAGFPCISDPGQKLVEIALKNEINVTCVPGANAALIALAASGLPSDHFYFHGFLSAKESEKINELKYLECKPETMIFYEAPHRIKKTLELLYKILGNRRICIARELTKIHEEFIRGKLDEIVFIDEQTLKGEMVLVVEGKQEDKVIALDDFSLVDMVKKQIENGLSTKDAVKNVSEETQISKNYIYNLYSNTVLKQNRN